MAGKGSRFRSAIARYIRSWNDGVDVLEEKPVGYRFVGSPRILDIVLHYNGKYMGIEAKLQETQGTAYQKLSYTLEDCKACPIPTIIVFAGSGIREDMRAKLITSGLGIEIKFLPDNNDPNRDAIEDPFNLLRQRIYIELGLDWFSLYK